MDRRSFLARLRWLFAYPLLAAHHRPDHAGGPPSSDPDVGWGAVYWAAVTAPSAAVVPVGVFDSAIFDPTIFDTGGT